MNKTKEKEAFFDWSLLSKYRTELMGFSILWIMLFHSSHGGVRFFDGVPGLDWLGQWLTYGNMGCEIFVVLSGIGLYFSFSKNSNLIDFYRKRFIRILIPVWMIWVPFWIWQTLKGSISVLQLLLGAASLRLFYDGNQYVWFVALMTVCYLLFPLIYHIIYCSDRGRLVRTLLMVGILIAAIAAARYYFPDRYKMCEIALNRMPVFILGVYFGSLVKDKRKGSAYWLPILFFAMIIGFDILNHHVLHGMERRLFYAIPALSLMFLTAALMERFPIPAVMKGFRLLGPVTLECYCTHVLFFNLYKKDLFILKFTEGSAAKYLLLLVMAAALAFLADFFEKNVLKVKAK